MFHRSQANAFVEKILNEAKAAGFAADEFLLDHICYRTSSTQEYEEVKHLVMSGVGSLFRGDLLGEEIINGRPIATYRLHDPLVIGNQCVEALEIPAPKPGKDYESGFEHIEVVTTETFEAIQAAHPDLSFDTVSTNKLINPELAVKLPSGVIKFHHLPLSCIIAIEKRPEFYSLLTDKGILKALSPWQPLLSGSMPLQLDIEKSDLDILLQAESLEGIEAKISAVLAPLGFRIQWFRSNSKQGECVVGTLKQGTQEIELFVSTVPVLNQHSHRHLLSEFCYLVKHGPAIRRALIEWKREGLTTEEAFAKVLKLPGNPYDVLLDLPFTVKKS